MQHSPTHHSAPRPKRQLRPDVKSSLIEGSAFSLMVGLGETYIPAFAMAVGLGQVNAGLIATLPLLAGALLQLITPAMVTFLKSYKRWVVLCATFQCLAFVPLIIAALVGYLPGPAAFLTVAIYWGAGMGAGASWNTWIATIIPCRLRPAFFAKRTRMTQFAALTGFLAGGILLHSGGRWPKATMPFAILFLCAFICRIISARWISRLSEPVPPSNAQMKPVPFADFIKLFRRKGDGGSLLLYLLSVQFAVQTAAPFFTPFMLGPLSLTYPQFAALIASSFAAKVISLPTLGLIASRHGAHRLLRIGGIGLVLIPAFWLVSSNFWYLFVLQFITGIFWGAYELASVLMLMEKIGEDERVGVLTNYNLLNAVMMSLGSIIGASVLDAAGQNTRAYYMIFLLSTVGRAATLFLLQRVHSEKLFWLPFPLQTLEFRHTMGFIAPRQWLIRAWRVTKLAPKRQLRARTRAQRRKAG